ncbi:MAG: NAD(P)H-dependent glycerol-3-phosphate dehydrogenase [Myxococcota bacterium]
MSPTYELDVQVVGGGAFGTALANILAGLDRRVRLWVRREDQAAEINERHTNNRYLEGYELAPSLEATTDLAAGVRRARIVLVVLPSTAFRGVVKEIGETIKGDQILLHATKGIEIGTFKRMSQILRQETCALKIGVLSGPNLAREIMAGQPAGSLVASRYDEVVSATQQAFAGGLFRVYGGRDVVGTEVGGSFKNIIAIAAGVATGLGLGDNAKALLVTRGLNEMARFGRSMGAAIVTFGGLAGIGDLMATCASPLSRNHQVGARLGKGETLDDILQSMTHVSEGVPTAKAVHAYAQAKGLDLPIVAAVNAMLYEGRSASDAVEELMALPTGDEMAALNVR